MSFNKKPFRRKPYIPSQPGRWRPGLYLKRIESAPELNNMPLPQEPEYDISTNEDGVLIVKSKPIDDEEQE